MPQMFPEFWCSPNSQKYLWRCTQMIGTMDFVSDRGLLRWKHTVRIAYACIYNTSPKGATIAYMSLIISQKMSELRRFKFPTKVKAFFFLSFVFQTPIYFLDSWENSVTVFKVFAYLDTPIEVTN